MVSQAYSMEDLKNSNKNPYRQAVSGSRSEAQKSWVVLVPPMQTAVIIMLQRVGNFC
jgi:hypothetical protein